MKPKQGTRSGRELCIAVSGLHLGENSQPGPGVIRSLREALGRDVRLIGLGYDVWDSSLHTRGYLDDAFLMPYPSAGPEEYWARLMEIDSEYPIDLLIPCLDLELPVIHCLTERLSGKGIHFALPSRKMLARRTKQRLTELAKDLDISVPETLTLSDVAELSNAVQQLGLPLVVKGAHCDADVVHSLDAAVASFNRLLTAWGGPVLAQRYVQGEEYNVMAVRDERTGRSASVAMRKTLVTRMGKAWAGVTVDDPAIQEFAAEVVNGLNWHGPCEVELLKAADGGLHLIEVNPRFPAWVYLSTAAGINLPLLLSQIALGQPLQPSAQPKPGVFYVRHAIELTGSTDDLAQLVSLGRMSSRPVASNSTSA